MKGVIVGEDRIAGAVAMAMLFIAAIWELLRTMPGALEKITLEGLFDAVGDIFSDPESVFPLIVFLQLLWALIAIAKFWVGVVDELFFTRDGPVRLGLKIGRNHGAPKRGRVSTKRRVAGRASG